MDYIAAMNNELGFVLAVEKLLELGRQADRDTRKGAVYPRRCVRDEPHCEPSSRVRDIRHGHRSVGRPFLYAFRDREAILGLFEDICGAGRLLYNYIRFGGVSRDLTPDFHHKLRRFLSKFEKNIDTYNTLLTNNKIFLERTKGVAVVSVDNGGSVRMDGSKPARVGHEMGPAEG